MAASYGDVIALKVDADAVALRDAVAKAAATGASAAYAIPIDSVVVRAGSNVAPRMLIGLPADAAARVEPFVSTGRMPEPGKSELVVSESDATSLGVSVGDTVIVASEAMAVVGLIELREAVWTGIDAASLWTTASDVASPVLTYVGARLAVGDDHDAWAKQYLEALGPDYSVLTASALQAPLVQWRDEIGSFCEAAKHSNRVAQPFRMGAWSCSDVARWETDAAIVREVWGDEFLWTGRDGRLEQAADVEGVRLESTTAYDGAVFDAQRAFPLSLHGVADGRLERLAPFVRSGSLNDVGTGGGVVLGSKLAAALGVGPGDDLQVAMRRTDPAQSVRKLVPAVLRVAAVAEFPRRLSESIAMHGWLHQDHAVGELSTAPNAAVAWGDTRSIAEAASRMSGTVVGPEGASNRVADLELFSELRAACNGAESRG